MKKEDIVVSLKVWLALYVLQNANMDMLVISMLLKW